MSKGRLTLTDIVLTCRADRVDVKTNTSRGIDFLVWYFGDREIKLDYLFYDRGNSETFVSLEDAPDICNEARNRGLYVSGTNL